MPVTVTVTDHVARGWPREKATSNEQLFKGSCRQEFKKSERLIHSSFESSAFEENHISPSENGFVYAAYDAYSNHHHLTIRPEDIWFAILSQTSFYINAHAEELRQNFVSHQRKKKLKVSSVGTIQELNVGQTVHELTEQIRDTVVDPELHTWIMPTFTTTAATDRAVASILMMGSMQQYFSYTSSMCCGLPSVTLLGERQDWLTIQRRLGKLREFGREPAKFATLLEPVLRGFIASFDAPDDASVRDFWGKITHSQSGSGPTYLSGWITAFCFWSEKGRCLHDDEDPDGCEMDGVRYHRVDTDRIPSGLAGVPLTVNDNGHKIHTRLVAGSVGVLATSNRLLSDGDRCDSGMSLQPSPEDDLVLDSVRPVSGWWMFEVEDP